MINGYIAPCEELGLCPFCKHPLGLTQIIDPYRRQPTQFSGYCNNCGLMTPEKDSREDLVKYCQGAQQKG